MKNADQRSWLQLFAADQQFYWQVGLCLNLWRDETQIQMDVIQTGVNGIQAGVNGIQTGANGIQTGMNGTQTGVKRIQTGVNGIQADVGEDLIELEADDTYFGQLFEKWAPCW